MSELIKNRHVCGLPTEVFSRVCGYFRPVRTFQGSSTWNLGKQEEYKDRVNYNVNKAVEKAMTPKENV